MDIPSCKLLDIIVEDGRDYFVYLNYSLLSFPKIVSKILPFAIFFSFFYVINKYENNNELMIFWNFGVEKTQLINFFLRFSVLITIFQLVATVLVVPESQNKSRSLIRTSNVDFIDSFVKPRKFNDNVNGLTIYAEEKYNNGNLKNLYLKKLNVMMIFKLQLRKEVYSKTKIILKYLFSTMDKL